MKILLSIPENPFDPTNGAARSMRTIAELMGSRGHQVRCVGTTATERPNAPVQLIDWLREGSLLGESYRGVEYRLVDVNGASTRKWRNSFTETDFDGAFEYSLQVFKPDILLCYGGHASDVRRYWHARRAGVKIVFGLRNYGYQARGFFDDFDGVLTSSLFLSDWYRSRFGARSTALPLPIWPEDVVAGEYDRKYFTMINPTSEKGLMIFVTVAAWLVKNRPDIPLMVVTDHHDHSTIADMTPATKIIPWQADPKAIYAQTKVLLVPSVWEEPAGRVIAEALLNGIPPIMTDRGGMSEVANGGGIVIPLAKYITPEWKRPVPTDIAAPWIDAITMLHDEQFTLVRASQRARVAGQIYQPENLGPRYETYFENVLRGDQSMAGQPEARNSGNSSIDRNSNWLEPTSSMGTPLRGLA